VWARCRRYNAALDRLHQLAAQLATMVRTGSVTLADSAVAYAYQHLSQLDEVMPGGRPRPWLQHRAARSPCRRIEFFARAMRISPRSSISRAGGRHPAPPRAHGAAHTPARSPRGWLRWFRGHSAMVHREGWFEERK